MNTINKDGGNIYRLLIEAGISKKMAQWITAQSAHETANFTSPIYRNNLNAFGMTVKDEFGKPLKPGISLAQGEKNGYAFYLNYKESVQDYYRLYKGYGFPVVGTLEAWVKFLKNQDYFEAPMLEYLRGMKHFLKLYFPGGELDKSLEIPGAGGTW
jgi:hypothetical protein